MADIIHVPGDYPTIQEAIDVAMNGDEVEVHPGTYNETINFLGKAITVYSTDGPDVTIIDAQQTGTVVTCDSGEGPDTVLDGFAITGGTGTDLFGTGQLYGGGMLNEGSSPTVTNCAFSGNTATRGGGMRNSGGSPTVTNCNFSGNSMAIKGGGMSNFASSAAVTNCAFSGNSAVNGGGMSNDSSSPTVTNCTFSGNSAFVGGGGMINSGFSPTVINCTFSGNSAGVFGGGGMFNVASSPTVTNCTFSGNSANGDGGGMSDAGAPVGNPTVANCIFWGDSPNEISEAGMVTVSYSDVQGGFTGTGNIDADPLFVDPENGDYRLMSGSPCIDAGNNWGVPIDENDYDEDGVLCELFPVDLDGNPRFNADEADFDPGCGVPVVVDMGAYEYQFDPADQVTFADLNGDNAVGVADLLELLASWGSCGKGCCLADLDIDGAVGLSDLLALLANWGPCS